MKEYFVGIFENDAQAPLNYLDDERKAIDVLLLQNNDVFNKEIIPNEGIDGFISKLQLLTNDMTIFHFSGHHNDTDGALKLSDEIFNDKGLIEILNNSPKLKIVFINGCSTQKIVEALHNVPIVIGTTTPVYDHFAKTLSTRFYELLLNQKDNLKNSDLISEIFKQAKGFLQGHYQNPDDQERGPMAADEIDKRVNNYSFKINNEAKDFEQRLTYYADPDSFPVRNRFKSLIDEIRNEEKLSEDLYKYYPYFLCIHLEILSDFDDINNSIYQKLSKERYWVIRSMFKEFLNFLKFSAYSIIWSISKESPEFKEKLTDQLKEILRENLEIGWGSYVQDKISEHLVYIYTNIPDEYLENNSLWKELKTSVLQNQSLFKEMSDFFSEYLEHNDKSKHDYIKTEFYLEKFLRNFKFLRSLAIESIYDVFYNQFKYDDQRSYIINRSYYPVSNRPTALDTKKSVVHEVNDNERAIDIDVHSVYICTTLNNNGKPKRELNLSPFYLDVNSTSVAKDKIKLYYLDRYSEATDKLIYREVINAKVYRNDASKKNKLGEEIEVPLNEDMILGLYKDGKKDIIEIEEKKKIRDHFEYIKNLISYS
ncbi:hypothetical protein D1816_03715 [Aquimarina sp. AD10]|uniref:CHAT domain-containing protein n=1 Tax=Aquimarina aggregata TaxID=1642818 RepID=A0A162DM59_9FLAO|nr:MULTISPECIES: hypothetical protein [Aquimarina]AXT59496.1 hypothetical protein D1816_03715 [Aquimarina sp. AD10]KZS42508.1 hypothetical protein AWE51_03435 [Aquimarina aggregata]RKN00397.1 hypothetical protein D7033_08545 [Aquimarina sp. AD10]